MRLHPVLADIINAYNKHYERTGRMPTKIYLRGDTILALQAEMGMNAKPTVVHGMAVEEENIVGDAIAPFKLL